MTKRSPLMAGGLLLLAAITAWIGIRASSATIANHVGERQIIAECSGWTGVSEGCATWGEEVLGAGAPSTTFEMEDVVRLRLDRAALGFASTCVAEYFLGRYPDEVAWTENVPCPGG
jgi:hypothetical protein